MNKEEVLIEALLHLEKDGMTWTSLAGKAIEEAKSDRELIKKINKVI